MRVAIITESPAVWGAEKSLLTLLENWEKESVPTVIVQQGSPLVDILRGMGIATVEHKFSLKAPAPSATNAPKRSPFKEAYSALWGGLRLRRLLASYDVALVFSVWLLPETLVASMFSHVRPVLDLHETFHGKFRTRALRVLVRFCSKLIAPSQSVLTQNGLTANRRKLSIIPRPVTTAGYQSRVTPPRVVIVGQVVPHKRVLELVRQVNWAASGHCLQIVGITAEPSARSEYERSVVEAALECGDHVVVTPYTQNIGKILAQSTAVINCSQHEAFGRTVAEAATYGAFPLALRDSGGPAEVIDNLGFGAVLDTFSDLEVLLQSGDIEAAVAKHGELAALRARTRFAPETVAREYVASVRDVFERRSRR